MTEINEESSYATEQDNVNTEKPSAPDQIRPTYNDEIEVFGEQFQNYLLIAQALLKSLKRPRDIEICTILLGKMQRLNDSKQAEIRLNNNSFFRYCLRVLKWTSDHQPLEWYQCLYRNQENTFDTLESRAWLEENKSYMAVKLLKDRTIVIYGAISNNPTAGWQDGGLKFLAKGLCEKSIN